MLELFDLRRRATEPWIELLELLTHSDITLLKSAILVARFGHHKQPCPVYK